MKIERITSFCLLFLTLQGCGRGVGTLEPSSLTIDSTSPAPSIVLEKVTRDSGLILYRRQEVTEDSVFYLEIATYWVNKTISTPIKEKRIDTLQDWREARISEEKVEAQAQGLSWRLGLLNELVHDD